MGAKPGYLKAGFLGFNGSGKTRTATLLACWIKNRFKLPGPIAFFDTEDGSGYVRDLIIELTGMEPVGIKSRSFDDLMQVGQECVDNSIAVLLVDSITHPWRNLCDSYLAGVNEAHKRRCEEKNWRFSPKTRLEFQDWNPIKAKWANWADLYLTSPLHIVMCGRAGYEYDYEINDQGKKELIKTGTKMKTETEFGFEPSLLVEMEAEVERTGEGDRTVRIATVRKDRFALIDGKSRAFPGLGDARKEMEAVASFFDPHLGKLNPDLHAPVKTAIRPMDVDADGNGDWEKEKKTRAILCEEIQGVLVSAIPGQSADEKKRKADLLMNNFGTRSWTAIESMQSEKLRAGMEALKSELAASQPKPEEPSKKTKQDQMELGKSS